MHTYASDYDQEPDDVTCNRCGAQGLSWVDTGVRWRLADSKGFHVCKLAGVDDFEDVTSPSSES